MKIKEGDVWKTRNGKEVTIVEAVKNPNITYPIVGEGPTPPIRTRWTEKGEYIKDNINPLDLTTLVSRKEDSMTGCWKTHRPRQNEVSDRISFWVTLKSGALTQRSGQFIKTYWESDIIAWWDCPPPSPYVPPFQWPEWIKPGCWLAHDDDGLWYIYEKEPEARGALFHSTAGLFLRMDPELLDITLPPLSEDFRDSLIQKPKEEEE